VLPPPLLLLVELVPMVMVKMLTTLVLSVPTNVSLVVVLLLTIV
jgi:hypothetical protein